MATRASNLYEKTEKQLIKEGRIKTLFIDKNEEIESMNFINSVMDSAKKLDRERRFA